MSLLSKFFDKILDFFHQISNIILFLLMFLLTADVVLRALFNNPITGTFEFVTLGSALLVFFTLATTHKYNEHISISFIIDKFPDSLKKIVEIINEILIFIIMILMSIQMYANAMRSMERNIVTSDLGLPYYPFILISIIGSILFALLAIRKIVHIIKGKEEDIT